MKSILASLLAAAAVFSSCSAFSIQPRTKARGVVSCQLHQGKSDCWEGESSNQISRRSALSTFTLLPLGFIASSHNPLPANAEGKGKVVVWGGAGWVGAHVASNLQKQGYDVVSISRSSAETQVARTKSILGTTLSGVEYISIDASSASLDDMAATMKDASAVISCVGIAPGSKDQRLGNGQVNARIAKAAKSAGAPKFVYIGVASSLANGPAKFLLGEYFQGKAEAEKSVSQEFGDKALIIKPAIVEGGTPGEIRPPGPPGVKPVDVEVLAKLVVAGALGQLNGNIDGNDNIVAMASS